MINRVLIAGRLQKPPEIGETLGGKPMTTLTLELKHPSWSGGEPDLCTVTVRAYGEGITGVISKYFSAGQDVLVEGQLRELTDGLCVVLDRFEFMRSKLETRYFWDDARQERRAA